MLVDLCFGGVGMYCYCLCIGLVWRWIYVFEGRRYLWVWWGICCCIDGLVWDLYFWLLYFVVDGFGFIVLCVVEYVVGCLCRGVGDGLGIVVWIGGIGVIVVFVWGGWIGSGILFGLCVCILW